MPGIVSVQDWPVPVAFIPIVWPPLYRESVSTIRLHPEAVKLRSSHSLRLELVTTLKVILEVLPFC
jgi:hypothetical protein